MLPSILLMYAIGKLGCFFVGCCHGIKYNGIFNVVYNYSLVALKGISLFPIQIVEFFVFIIIFIIFFLKTRKHKCNTRDIALLFIICGSSKFLLDYLRISHIRKILSVNQFISILFVIVGILLLLKNKKNK